jgi:hypothetical protein
VIKEITDLGPDKASQHLMEVSMPLAVEPLDLFPVVVLQAKKPSEIRT